MARARAIDTRLEKLLPSTDELFVAGILTKEEIQHLVKDRTSHEYKLVARPLLLIDVKNAINFELSLEKKIANFCAEFNRQAALEASGKDEDGRKKRGGAPLKKLQLKHRWAVQERIESIYRIGLKHLFTQRKTASLLQLKRKCTLTTAALSGASASHVAAPTTTTNGRNNKGPEPLSTAQSGPVDDFEVIRRECVAQLKAFSRNVSLSKLYADWLTRSPQDAFLWSEAALFEAQNGRNDEARAIIQQAIATLRQTTSTAKSSATAIATATATVKIAGKDFARQKASEEAKEVWGTAVLIEILFAKKLLEGAIETAVRNDDTEPVTSIRKENEALAAIVFDLALAEAVVSEASQAAAPGALPFLCPDLGLHLYSVAVCHQFTAGLSRKILLMSLATASANDSASSTANASAGPLTALLSELFLSEVRFTASNCVTAERFATEKAQADLAMLKANPNRGVEVQREWVVKHLHRKHKVVTIKEKKERVVASIGAAVTLLLSIQYSEKALASPSAPGLVARLVGQSSNTADKSSETLFGALIRTIIASAGTSSGSLQTLRMSVSDAIYELLSLSRDLIPMHIDEAHDAIAALEGAIAEDKSERERLAVLAEKKAKKGGKRGREGPAKEDELKADVDVEGAPIDSDALISATANKVFLFTQSESSRILRVVMLLQTVSSTSARALSVLAALEDTFAALLNGESAPSKSKKNDPSPVAATAKKEAAAAYELFSELCAAAGLMVTNDNSSNAEAADVGGKKKERKQQPSDIDKANRKLVVALGTSGTRLLKSFVEVAFEGTTLSRHSADLGAAADNFEKLDSDAGNAFVEHATPTTSVTVPTVRRESLWWASTSNATNPLLDTKFLSIRMLPMDLVSFLEVTQLTSSTAATSPRKGATPSSAAFPAESQDSVEVQVSRLLALIDNEDALFHSRSIAPTTTPVTPVLDALKETPRGKKKATTTPPTTANDLEAVQSEAVAKLALALQKLVCRTTAQGAYIPYDPSLWRLFAALQHTLSQRIQKAQELDLAHPIGAKTLRASDDDDSSDDEESTARAAKKKLRMGATAATSSAASSPSTAAAPSVIAQRSELGALLDEAQELAETASVAALQTLARRIYFVSLQIISGGSNHASLPTAELRVERLRGILALTLVELNRELAVGLGSTKKSLQSRVSFNSSAVFMAAQVLRFRQLINILGGKDGSAPLSTSVDQIAAIFAQFQRIHNQLLPPVRLPEFTLVKLDESTSHGYCTPIPRAMLKYLMIPAFAATHAAAQALPGPSAKPIVAATVKMLRSLLAQLTALYVVEVKEAGKYGNGIRSSSQYAIVQRKEVSEYILQNRPEAFMPYFFAEASHEGNASLTKVFIANSQVSDWLLTISFEQHIAKDLKAAHDAHQRALRMVETPQALLASTDIPALY